MSAKSWDHRVILLPPRRLDQAQSCSVRCPSPVTHMTSYRYVTGQYGRTTTARRHVCTDHATQFAARHGLAMPTEPSPVEPSPLDQAVQAAALRCERCPTPAQGVCCSSHGKVLCHRCYRTTHFVQVCVEGCDACQAEGLALVLS